MRITRNLNWLHRIPLPSASKLYYSVSPVHHRLASKNFLLIRIRMCASLTRKKQIKKFQKVRELIFEESFVNKLPEDFLQTQIRVPSRLKDFLKDAIITSCGGRKMEFNLFLYFSLA